MNEVAFVASRERDWARLRELSSKAAVSPTYLRAEELEELSRLYRSASADLAFVRTRTGNDALVDHLNAIVGECYGVLYRAPRRRVTGLALEAVDGILGCLRRRRWMVATSLAVFAAGTVFGAALLSVRPDLRSHVVPPGMEESFQQWRQGRHLPASAENQVMALGFYSVNNPLVSIMAASSAISSFGGGTVVSMWRNGAILGALGQDMAEAGKLGFLLASLAPHGLTEIPGAIIAGAAGLCLAWALIAPGRLGRAAAIVAAGKDALILILTAVGMMLIAAPFEAFVSFNPRVPQALKAFIGLVVLAAWCAFWFGFRRPSVQPTEKVARQA